MCKSKENEINHLQTNNCLDFEVIERPYPSFSDKSLFRVGTCEGLWQCIEDCYVIIGIINNCPGNGHFDDVLEWFEFSCKRDNKNLLVVECLNNKFYLHLLAKRGFKPLDDKGNNCIKVFNKTAYKRLLKHGNKIIKKGSLQAV
jgi:hypothetical protein